MKFFKDLKAAKLIVIARNIPLEQISPCVEAVLSANINFLEVTFNPSDPNTLCDTAQKVALIKDKFPQIRLGCGTVLTTDMVKAAVDSGAEYIISPNVSEKVINLTRKLGAYSIPGAYTPSEIVNAYDMGASIIKIFPIQPEEESYVKNIMTPLSHIPFILTGGVNPVTIGAMLSTGALAVAAGASIFSPELIANKNYQEIANLAQKHMENC